MSCCGYFRSCSEHVRHSHYIFNTGHLAKNFGVATVFVGCSLGCGRDSVASRRLHIDPKPSFVTLGHTGFSQNRNSTLNDGELGEQHLRTFQDNERSTRHWRRRSGQR